MSGDGGFAAGLEAQRQECVAQLRALYEECAELDTVIAQMTLPQQRQFWSAEVAVRRRRCVEMLQALERLGR